MSEQLKAVILNASTGLVIERSFTPEEEQDYYTSKAEYQEIKKAQDALRASALAKLAALGLTQDEIDAL